MPLYRSAQSTARLPAMAALMAAAAVPLVFEHTIKAGQFAAGDIIEMGALPAGMVPAAAPVLVADDADASATPTLTLDVGLMSGDYLAATNANGSARTCGAEFFAASAIGQTGGVATSAVLAGMKLAPSASDRSVGLRVAAAAATLTAGAKIRLLMLVAPAPVGIAEV